MARYPVAGERFLMCITIIDEHRDAAHNTITNIKYTSAQEQNQLSPYITSTDSSEIPGLHIEEKRIESHQLITTAHFYYRAMHVVQSAVLPS